jgi:WD40 repeat protein/serine/threonine protein kinase
MSQPIDPLTHSAADLAATTGGQENGSIMTATAPSSQRFVLGSAIARGGMGEVYRATDTVLNREVAVKVLQEKYSPTSGTARRFEDEARITGQLQHPNIPAVHDLGMLPDGRPFLAMKLIKGQTLDDLLKQRENPASERGRFIAVFEQICQAVAYAHAHDVIHRDLKPANIMVGTFGEVQVMDWGLAKVLGSRPENVDPDPQATTSPTEVKSLRDSDDLMTQAGSVLGTPAFMPPEQALGAVHEIDARSDVFGLGGILAAIITGRPPFIGDTAETTRVMAARGELTECFARLDASGADPELVELCKKCLASNRRERLADAGVVSREIAALRAQADERARQAELDKVKAEEEKKSADLKADEQRKRRRLVSLSAIFMIAALSIGGITSAFYAIRAEQNALRADQNAGELAKKVTEVELAQKEAESKAAEAGRSSEMARNAEIESRRQLVRQNILTGARSFDTGDPAVALLWFHRAMESDPDPENATSHRTRIASLLGQQPELLGVCFHSTRVCDAVFSPDGTCVLARSDANEAFIWDYSKSRLIAPPLRHDARIRHVCYSPAGGLVATASADGTACLWNASTGAKLHTLRHEGPLTWVEFHPKEPKILTTSEDKSIRLWDTKTGQQLDWKFPSEDILEHATFSPDGTQLVVTKKSGTARVWKLDPPEPISPEFPQKVSDLNQRYTFNYDSWPRFSPDGKSVLSFKDREFRIWSGNENIELISLPLFSLEAYFVGSAGRVFVTGAASTAVVVDRLEKRVQLKLAHPRHANIGGVSPDGRYLITSSSGGLIHLWNATTGKEVWTQRCGDFASALSFSRDSTKCLASSQDGTIRVWKCIPKREYQAYRHDDGRANVIFNNFPDGHSENLSPDGSKRVSFRGPNPPTLFLEGNKEGIPLEFPAEFDNAQFCNDGSRMILTSTRAIATADALTGKLIRPPMPLGEGGKAFHLNRVSRDATRVALWDDPKTISVWNLTTGLRVFGPTRNANPGRLDFGPTSAEGQVQEIALSPDGRRLASFTQSSGTLTVYDVNTGTMMHHGKWFRGSVWGFGFSADSRRVFAWVSDATARVFDVETGLPAGPAVRTTINRSESTDTTRLRHCDISPDGRHIVAFDPTLPGVRMWDATGGDLLMSVPTPGITSPSLLWFAADGSRFNVISGQKSLTVTIPRFDSPSAQLVEPLVRLLSGQRLDNTGGVDFVDQEEFRKNPELYRQVFLEWKGLIEESPSSATATTGITNQQKTNATGVVTSKEAQGFSPTVARYNSAVLQFAERSEYTEAMQLLKQVSEAHPQWFSDPRTFFRYNSACCAARAASDLGTKSATTADRAAWRRNAFNWLKADLLAWKQLASSPARSSALSSLENWLVDPDLSSLRSGLARIPMPAEERIEWDKLWVDVRGIIAELSKSPEPTETAPPPREKK